MLDPLIAVAKKTQFNHPGGGQSVQQACGKAGCEEVSTSVDTEYNQIMIQNTRTVSSPARKKHIH